MLRNISSEFYEARHPIILQRVKNFHHYLELRS